MQPARYAISYTPPPDSPLARFGAGVLGYDNFTGAAVPHSTIAGIEPSLLTLATVELRRHGFHAGLTVPFGLDAQREDELDAAVGAFAAAHRPVMIGALAVDAVDAFVVLRPAQPYAAVEEFAAACAVAFDDFGGPPSGRELGRSAFRMTLAGPLPDDQRGHFTAMLAQAFARHAADQIELDSISLMRQDDPGAAFRVMSRRRLSAK